MQWYRYDLRVLRKGFWWLKRRERGAAAPGLMIELDGAALPLIEAAGGGAIPMSQLEATSLPGRRFTRKRIAFGVLLALFVAMGGVYSQKDKFSAQFADFSRSVIGDENTARLESWFFTIEDRIDKAKYRVFGGSTNPFGNAQVRVEPAPQPTQRTIVFYAGTTGKTPDAPLIADSLGPAPMVLPETRALRDNPEPGEGTWSTAGLPHTTPNDVLMAKTFIRPDKSRPYAMAGVLLMDQRRVRLHMTGGTVDPGGYRGVKGEGVIPPEAYPQLLAAWNGGFKGQHGGFGMYAEGREYVPLRNGLATLCVAKDGTLSMGEWGNGITWNDKYEACRQNAVLLVQDGEVSKRTAEGNDTWGYVQVDSSEFITWRSAVGLTKDGNLLYAAGNSLSAETLAKALWAAGAYTAMQLDINSPYVLLGLYFNQPDGSQKAERFMDNMPDSPRRFLGTQERDFMWVTLDESRYR